jgi:protein-S-isoprenylcysteine O-methyltransferase Ste14
MGRPISAVQEQQRVVQNELYRRVRHPALCWGLLLSSLAWPIIYGTPVTFVGTAILRVLMLRRRIRVAEACSKEIDVPVVVPPTKRR